GIGRSTGESWRLAGKTAWNRWGAGLAARCRSLARYDESRAAPAKIVSARPETIWLARRVITRKARIAAVNAPASPAAPTAAASETALAACIRCPGQHANAAPMRTL